MKQLILITFLFLSTTISAQDTTKTKEIPKFQHHINIGYSYNAWNQLFLFFSQLGGFGEYNQGGYFYNLDSIGDYNRVKDWKINSLNFAYNFTPKKTPRCTFGISGVIDVYKRFGYYTVEDKNLNVTNTEVVYNIMANAYYHYLKKTNWVDLYLGGDFGFMMMHSKTIDTENKKKESSVQPNLSFNICPFGIRLKTRVSPYLQANIGSRGWVEGGIAFDF